MGESFEYGIFNESKDKILAANLISKEDEDNWTYLWEDPIAYSYDEGDALSRANRMNSERDVNVFGPVVVRKRTVNYGKWQDLDRN